MMNLILSMYAKATGAINNERGAQSLEWLGIAAVLIMVVGIVGTVLNEGIVSNGVTDIIDGIFDKINRSL
ncbi:hypothetical protein [Salipaludibacillus daqingensis]|uniref:hypothetical protein n=1 Tax=Salipaludibacillus daqingensis TaxID=3041001 RepID=UPI002473DB8C|nr:hypothetical protein [Salipaludibacillus daqingensis]